MYRPLVLAALPVMLALTAVACAGDETPSGTQTAAAGASVPAESPSPAVPAVAPADQDAYRQGIVGRGIVQETCSYEADERVADCGARGRFALDPAPTSSDASCVVGLSGAMPQFVLCTAPGADSKFYAVQS